MELICFVVLPFKHILYLYHFFSLLKTHSKVSVYEILDESLQIKQVVLKYVSCTTLLILISYVFIICTLEGIVTDLQTRALCTSVIEKCYFNVENNSKFENGCRFFPLQTFDHIYLQDYIKCVFYISTFEVWGCIIILILLHI